MWLAVDHPFTTFLGKGGLKASSSSHWIFCRNSATLPSPHGASPRPGYSNRLVPATTARDPGSTRTSHPCLACSRGSPNWYRESPILDYFWGFFWRDAVHLGSRDQLFSSRPVSYCICKSLLSISSIFWCLSLPFATPPHATPSELDHESAWE